MTVQTIHNEGDTVFFLDNNQITTGIVIGIITRTGYIERNYAMSNGTFYYLKCSQYDRQDINESLLFKTKEELLNSL